MMKFYRALIFLLCLLYCLTLILIATPEVSEDYKSYYITGTAKFSPTEISDLCFVSKYKSVKKLKHESR
jgi:hypothetical protein